MRKIHTLCKLGFHSQKEYKRQFYQKNKHGDDVIVKKKPVIICLSCGELLKSSEIEYKDCMIKNQIEWDTKNNL